MIATLILALGLNAAAAADDWPRFRGPNGENTVPDARIVKSFPADGPNIAWERDVEPGYGGAAIVGDEAFILDRVFGEKDILYCLSLEDGSERWKWENEVPGRISHPGSRSTPSVTGDTVYACGGFGHVYAIDRATHEARWVVNMTEVFGAQPPRFGYAIHPQVYGDTVIVAPTGEDVGLAALNKADGSVAWRSVPFGSSQSSPQILRMLGRDIVFMPGSDRGTRQLFLKGYDPADGALLAEFTGSFDGSVHNSIPNLTVIDEDTGFLTGGYGQGSYVMDFSAEGDTISVKQTNKIGAGGMIHPGLKVGDRIYMTADGSRQSDSDISGLVCMNLAGEIQWTTGRDPGFNNGSLILAGDTIVSQDGDSGLLRLIEPGDSYKMLAEGKVFSKPTGGELWAPLAFGNGRLVMRSQNQLVCVDLRPGDS
jgi:hypothetical protein